MRTALAKQNNIRANFCGIFERFGTKKNYHGFPEKTVLLKEITDGAGKIICDHLWFNFTKQFQGLGEISKGARISFDARVKEYVKGYVNHREFIDNSASDYKLSHPTKVKII